MIFHVKKSVCLLLFQLLHIHYPKAQRWNSSPAGWDQGAGGIRNHGVHYLFDRKFFFGAQQRYSFKFPDDEGPFLPRHPAFEPWPSSLWILLFLLLLRQNVLSQKLLLRLPLLCPWVDVQRGSLRLGAGKEKVEGDKEEISLFYPAGKNVGKDTTLSTNQLICSTYQAGEHNVTPINVLMNSKFICRKANCCSMHSLYQRWFLVGPSPFHCSYTYKPYREICPSKKIRLNNPPWRRPKIACHNTRFWNPKRLILTHFSQKKLKKILPVEAFV